MPGSGRCTWGRVSGVERERAKMKWESVQAMSQTVDGAKGVEFGA